MKPKLLLAFGISTAPASNLAAQDSSQLHLDASLNLFMAGMSGDVTAKGLPAPIDAGFGDLLENLEASAAGRVTLAYGSWFVSTEFCKNFTLFAGSRYNNIDGDITFSGPAGTVSTGTQDWWDPIVGSQLTAGLFGHEVGGFGLGSDLTWQAFPYVNWRFANSASLQVGYRWLGTDYETGSGLNKFRYDVVVQGPQVGLTLHL